VTTARGHSAEIVAGWALHAGDRIEMTVPGGGAITAEVTEIITAPAGDGAAAVHELSWSAEDGEACGRLGYSPGELVTRLSANRTVQAA
jgi:hypothetical protein